MTVRPRHTIRDKARDLAALARLITEAWLPTARRFVTDVPPIAAREAAAIIRRRYTEPPLPSATRSSSSHPHDGAGARRQSLERGRGPSKGGRW